MGLAKTFLSIGISIVFAAFVAYGLSVVYEAPKYDFAQNNCYLKYNCYEPINECQKQYEPQSTDANGTQRTPVPLPSGIQECYDNYTRTPEYRACQQSLDQCNEEYNKQSPQYAYSRNVFIILLVIGVAAVAGGSMMAAEGIGSGIIGGGVLVILYSIVSSMSYLYNIDKYLKLIGLGIALAVLIFVAYKRLGNGNRN